MGKSRATVHGTVEVTRKIEAELKFTVTVRDLEIGGAWYNDRVVLEHDGETYTLAKGDSLTLSFPLDTLDSILS